jgi:hypothetical protein
MYDYHDFLRVIEPELWKGRERKWFWSKASARLTEMTVSLSEPTTDFFCYRIQGQSRLRQAQCSRRDTRAALVRVRLHGFRIGNVLDGESAMRD